MKLAYELWDVFTHKAFSGNPLAVVPDASTLTSEQMQQIAKEFNLSETSFILPSDVADVRARYFTPARELPMAGHPSIGTSYSLQRAGKTQGQELKLELGVGVIPMQLELNEGRLEQVWMQQGIAKLVTEITDRQAMARALGITVSDLIDTLPIQVVSTGNPFVLVPVDSLDVLLNTRLDLAQLPADIVGDHRAVLVFTFDAPDSDIRCRMFGEAMGVREDPATGSAHGPLGWYVAQHELLEMHDNVVSFTSHQGVEMGRPSELKVRVTKTEEGYSVAVGGQAVLVGEGHLFLGDA